MTRKIFSDDADKHRPQTRQEFLIAVGEQRALGLKAQDIAAAFGLTKPAVLQMFFELDNGEPQFGTNRPRPRGVQWE